MRNIPTPTPELLPDQWARWAITGDSDGNVPDCLRELKSRIASAVALARTQVLNKERAKCGEDED